MHKLYCTIDCFMNLTKILDHLQNDPPSHQPLYSVNVPWDQLTVLCFRHLNFFSNIRDCSRTYIIIKPEGTNVATGGDRMQLGPRVLVSTALARRKLCLLNEHQPQKAFEPFSTCWIGDYELELFVRLRCQINSEISRANNIVSSVTT